MKTKSLILLSTFWVSGILLSQETILPADRNGENSEVQIIKCTQFKISKPLAESNDPSAEPEKLRESEDRKHRIAQKFVYSAEDGPEYAEDPSVRQTSMGTAELKAPITNWPGQSDGGYPPDPSGAVGPNHYVQAVNATPFRVFDKTSGSILFTGSVGSLFGSNNNDGDPIVMYDKTADRWFISQFGTNNEIFIAISQTPSPTGAYYTYTFQSPQFPDYLKFSIWWDGYYMTSNQNNQKVFVFERDKMILGDPNARGFFKSFNPTQGGGFFVPLPADADGTIPSVGTPCPIFSYTDNAWGNGAIDGIQIYKMAVNWVPATPTATLTLDANLALSPFDASYNQNWNDISQPGTTSKLDGIGGVLMYRAPWRKWTGYNVVVLNFAVKISTTQRSIRWCEIRQNQSTGAWSVFQEGTYAPDVYSRWCGSIAMDNNGSIALCYAKSGSSVVYPGLAYTGRLATDPLGQMTFNEVNAQPGSASQIGVNRFGDYSQTSIDPSDGLTFWHTGEYIKSGGVPATRIYSFQLSLSGNAGFDEEATTDAKVTAFQDGNNLIVNGINLKSNEEVVIDLFDANGRELKKQTAVPSSNTVQTSFEISDLAQGTYIVRIGRMNTSFQRVIKVFIVK